MTQAEIHQAQQEHQAWTESQEVVHWVNQYVYELVNADNYFYSEYFGTKDGASCR